MADVKVRKLPDWVVLAHRSRAERAGRSLEEELRVLLTDAALKPQNEFAERARVFRQGLRRQFGELSDSTKEIRKDRQSHG